MSDTYREQSEIFRLRRDVNRLIHEIREGHGSSSGFSPNGAGPYLDWDWAVVENMLRDAKGALFNAEQHLRKKSGIEPLPRET